MSRPAVRICHLYGNLLNPYGDNGNLLMLCYVARQRGCEVCTEMISLEDEFDPMRYDLVFMGGGQDHEQQVVAKDLPSKKDALKAYIEDDGVLLAICGGYQLLGQFYETADGLKVQGAGVLPHYTVHQKNNRFVGDVSITNERTQEVYEGFENHNGKTYLGQGEEALGMVTKGFGNNGEDRTEGARYKNVYCSYFHGPLLVRNIHLAERLVDTALKRKALREQD